MSTPDWLPPLLLLDDHEGDWSIYEAAVYAIFLRDFVTSQPRLHGRAVVLGRSPLVDGRESSYWHFTSSGADEASREPDFRRCERIGWPRAIIEAAGEPEVHCWRVKRGQERRILLALDDFGYIVVLADRGRVLVPVTAYVVEQPKRRERLRAEYLACSGDQKC